MATTTDGSGDGDLLDDGDHLVHFYEDDHDLAATAFAPLVAAAGRGDAIVAIATDTHLQGLQSLLERAGVDVDRERAAGRIHLLDAVDTLRAICPQGVPDAAAFARIAGDVLEAAGAAGRRVHVFGEMVGLLWDGGDVAAAIELEELWEDIGGHVAFSLRCGYPAGLTTVDGAAEAYAAICDLHSAMLDGAPTPTGAERVRHLPMSRSAPAAARRFVAEALADWGASWDDVVDPALLVVTELTTNAVAHGHSSCTVALGRAHGVLRISVGDRHPALPVVREPDAARPGGRGLYLVDRLSLRWGVEAGEGGKVVWADLDPEPPAVRLDAD